MQYVQSCPRHHKYLNPAQNCNKIIYLDTPYAFFYRSSFSKYTSLSLFLYLSFFSRIDRIHVGISLDETKFYYAHSDNEFVHRTPKTLLPNSSYQIGCNIIAKHINSNVSNFLPYCCVWDDWVNRVLWGQETLVPLPFVFVCMWLFFFNFWPILSLSFVVERCFTFGSLSLSFSLSLSLSFFSILRPCLRLQDVNWYVYLLQNNNKGRDIVTILRYIDISLFVGDTVLTSQVANFFRLFLKSVESLTLS